MFFLEEDEPFPLGIMPMQNMFELLRFEDAKNKKDLKWY